MPNVRPVDSNLKAIAVDFEAQILPGTFEHAARVFGDQGNRPRIPVIA